LTSQGYSVHDAVLRTAAQRLRPVLLTTITTIFGLLPMVFQLNVDWMGRSLAIGSATSAWWVQLATAISFGLAFATILTLLLTPILLAAPDVWRENFKRWFSRKKQSEKAEKTTACEDENQAVALTKLKEAAE